MQHPETVMYKLKQFSLFENPALFGEQEGGIIK